MIGREVGIRTADGVMNSFVVHPDEGGPYPVVLFYMDAAGKREELHDMARRIAAVGYFVVLPNLYYRDVEEFHIGMLGATRDRMFELMNRLSNAKVCEDTKEMLAFTDRDDRARKGPVGAVGYCMGGPFVFAAAGAFPERIRAAASFHGVRLCTDQSDSPHLAAERIEAEMYFGCAEQDAYAPKEMIERLDAHLARTGIRYRIEEYPGTEHGFVFPERKAKYKKEAAERHWERLYALLQRNL